MSATTTEGTEPSPQEPSITSRVEFTVRAWIALGLMAVLAVAPLFLFTGDPTPYILGVPWWGWAAFFIYWIILGLVVFFIREIGLIKATEEALE